MFVTGGQALCDVHGRFIQNVDRLHSNWWSCGVDVHGSIHANCEQTYNVFWISWHSSYKCCGQASPHCDVHRASCRHSVDKLTVCSDVHRRVCSDCEQSHAVPWCSQQCTVCFMVCDVHRVHWDGRNTSCSVMSVSVSVSVSVLTDVNVSVHSYWSCHMTPCDVHAGAQWNTGQVYLACSQHCEQAYFTFSSVHKTVHLISVDKLDKVLLMTVLAAWTATSHVQWLFLNRRLHYRMCVYVYVYVCVCFTENACVKDNVYMLQDPCYSFV